MSFLPSLHQYADFGLLGLRIAIGLIFLAHGWSKQSAWKQPAKGMNNVMRLLSIVEPLGGLALLLGIFTQEAAIGLALIMCGAIYFKITKWKVPFSSSEKNAWEFDLLILAGCLALLTLGVGSLTLGRYLGV